MGALSNLVEEVTPSLVERMCETGLVDPIDSVRAETARSLSKLLSKNVRNFIIIAQVEIEFFGEASQKLGAEL